jgi:glycogen debranching enzyme
LVRLYTGHCPVMIEPALQSAYRVLQDSIIHYRGEPVGTMAACDPEGIAAENYQDCFVRDFAASAMVFLADGEYGIVRNFLVTVLELHSQRKADTGHELVSGVMPASFRVVRDENGRESLHADFGDKAIGRVTPVDSMLWWMLLLGVYVRISDDRALVKRLEVQETIRQILQLMLRESFEDFPTLLVPDGSFMIDRRLGVHGHPLEIQVLLFAALEVGRELLEPSGENRALAKLALQRRRALRSYLRLFYWLDLERLNEIHRFNTEEFGDGTVNMLNVYPESIPDWLVDWLPDDAGYLVGNLGPGRMDFRFFARGNLLAIQFGLVYEEQAQAILNLYAERQDDLVGSMPAKICYPAMEGDEWKMVTGSDPKNVPWSYHNGGNWPVLLQSLTAAAARMGRLDIAQQAMDQAMLRLPGDRWPEYYDGRKGRLIGRRANRYQVWSATSFIMSHKVLEQPELPGLFTPESWRQKKTPVI